MIDFIDVSIHFTGEDLFTGASFKINHQDKIALVGANGSGKSTILKMLTKNLQPSSGKINFQKNIKLGFLPQEFINSSPLPLFQEVKNSLSFIYEIETMEEKLHRLLETTEDEDEKNKLSHQLGDLEHQKHFLDYYSLESKIEKVLMGLGFKESEFDKPANQFSGGWQMRIELSKILLGRNDMLLMDEPTNHLDLDSLQWLVDFLKSYKGALLLVSHDKYFLNQLTNRTIELFNKTVTFFNGNYDKYLDFKVQRDEQLIASFESQERKRKQTEKFIERFRYKSTKAKQVQSRIKQLEKVERIELPNFESKIEIKFPPAPPSGALPLEVQKLSKSFGDNGVFQNLNLQIERGDKIAFVGPNGAGKTTLAKIIAGQLEPSSGVLNYGHNTFISYYAQEVANALNLDSDVLDVVADTAPDLTPGQIRNLLGSFLFSDDDVFKKVNVLSGGEKSRVALAKILVTKANLIILDEPTNHLDINSKEILRKALVDFNGSLIIVSHDIDFLRPITNKVLEIKNNYAKLYHGNIDYFLFKKQNEGLEQTRETQKDSDSASRKDQKRYEAERRNEKHAATKELKKKLSEVESGIEKMEISKSKLEIDLASEAVYSNPQLAKEKNYEYEQAKLKLETLYSQWTEIAESLEQIEKSFEN